ncbi:hypothetical protein HK097_001524 [Rhizophlyctis rosea]|uniref:Sacsin/Nov domain-containing protein n=1 Tax=Rhizophlyctis rosea TaxID=64517 RepID=A0AAD5SHD5_9FUNG|nr:hypothetical protein HK097_001524 [Rhizophlyctis rosea]
MTSRQRKHIESIRHEQLLDCDEVDKGANSTVKAGVSWLHLQVTNSLKMLADQLNSKKTHFLLELLQNCEDNTYAPNVVPDVSICFRKDVVVIHNNEVGFRPEDVTSITRVGQSTKKNMAGFIGEKGIGFKSVFKVADEVYIKSGGYSFRFDAKKPLIGMIAPEWVENFTIPSPPSTTTIALKLKPNIDSEHIASQLEELHGNLLLFLKKISRLTVETQNTTAKYVRERRGSDISITRYSLAPAEVSLFKVSRVEADMRSVQEEKREGVHRSELILAFKHDGTGPVEDPCEVFAFLPLRAYGFKFIIQGDFLVTAAREGIITDSAWNKCIIDHLPNAFIQAIPLFTDKSTPLRWNFLSYVPICSDISDAFFFPAVERLLDRLRKQPIILTINSDFVEPQKCIACPKLFTINDKDPLIPNSAMKRINGIVYRHPAYTVPQQLQKWIEYQTLDIALFMATLKLYDCSQNPPEWFEKLFEKLKQMPTKQQRIRTHGKRKDAVDIDALKKSFKIFMLDTGEVVTMADRTIFFTSPTITKAPDKSFHFLHPEMHQSTDSRYFLVSLGITEADPANIAHKILDLHSSWSDTDDPDPSEIATHLQFLHLNFASIRPTDLEKMKEKLYLRIEGGTEYASPEDLYLPTAELKSLLRGEERSAWFVHPGAIDPNATQLHPRYHDFLVALGVNDCIRVALRDGRLSAEFEKVVKKEEQGEALLIMLSQHWSSKYQQYVKSKPQFVQLVSDMRVKVDFRSTGRAWKPLKSTYLKRTAITALLGGDLPFVQLQAPSEQRWDFLENFGVGIRPGGKALLKRLEEMSESGNDVEKRRVDDIYGALQQLVRSGNKFDRERFKTAKLIYIPGTRTTNPCWTSLHTCRWAGDPTVFPSLHFLKDIYPTFDTLFVEYFKVPNIEVSDWAVELERLVSQPAPVPASDVKMCWRILREVATWVGRREVHTMPDDAEEGGDEANGFPDLVGDEEWLKTLLTKPIFYTRTRDGNKGFRASNGLLVVPDDADCVKLFSRNVDILDVPVEEVPALKPLFQKVTPPLFFLSKIVRRDPKPLGRMVRKEDFERRLEEVMPLIGRCIYNWSAPHYTDLSRRLRYLSTAKVYTAEAIQNVCTLTYDGETFQKTGRQHAYLGAAPTTGLSPGAPRTDSPVVYTAFPPDLPIMQQLYNLMLCCKKYARLPVHVMDKAHMLIQMEGAEDRERFLKGHGIGELPEDWGQPVQIRISQSPRYTPCSSGPSAPSTSYGPYGSRGRDRSRDMSEESERPLKRSRVGEAARRAVMFQDEDGVIDVDAWYEQRMSEGPQNGSPSTLMARRSLSVNVKREETPMKQRNSADDVELIDMDDDFVIVKREQSPAPAPASEEPEASPSATIIKSENSSAPALEDPVAPSSNEMDLDERPSAAAGLESPEGGMDEAESSGAEPRLQNSTSGDINADHPSADDDEANMQIDEHEEVLRAFPVPTAPLLYDEPDERDEMTSIDAPFINNGSNRVISSASGSGDAAAEDNVPQNADTEQPAVSTDRSATCPRTPSPPNTHADARSGETTNKTHPTGSNGPNIVQFRLPSDGVILPAIDDPDSDDDVLMDGGDENEDDVPALKGHEQIATQEESGNPNGETSGHKTYASELAGGDQLAASRSNVHIDDPMVEDRPLTVEEQPRAVEDQQLAAPQYVQRAHTHLSTHIPDFPPLTETTSQKSYTLSYVDSRDLMNTFCKQNGDVLGAIPASGATWRILVKTMETDGEVKMTKEEYDEAQLVYGLNGPTILAILIVPPEVLAGDAEAWKPRIWIDPLMLYDERQITMGFREAS